MIAALLAIAASFAPPIGGFRYTIRDLYSAQPHQAVITVDRLAFTRVDGVTVAHLTTVSRQIDAAAPAKAALERLFGPLIDVESKVAVDATGAPGTLIDSDRPWAAFLASRAALRAKIDADPTVPPATKAVAHRALAIETDPASRDVRLREPFLQLLPPHLPPLAIGGEGGFTATIPTATGPLPATGKTILLAADGVQLRYRISMVTAPIAPANAYYSETNDLAIDRETGLLASAHRVRSLVFADGHSQPVVVEDITREP